MIQLVKGLPHKPWQQAWRGVSSELVVVTPTHDATEYEIEVKSVLGQTLADAQAYLKDLGLTAGFFDKEAPVAKSAKTLSLVVPNYRRTAWFPIMQVDYHLRSDYVDIDFGYLPDDIAIFVRASQDPLGES